MKSNTTYRGGGSIDRQEVQAPCRGERLLQHARDRVSSTFHDPRPRGSAPSLLSIRDMLSKFTCLRTARLAARHPCRRTFATAQSNRPDFVRIVEVGPRDGLQNEKQTIPVATKIELVNRLAQTGLRTIEAGSFVSPAWVPQVRHNQTWDGACS